MELPWPSHLDKEYLGTRPCWLTGTTLPPPHQLNCHHQLPAGIIKLEYITHRLPKLNILQLVFVGPESEGKKSVPVLQGGYLVLDMDMSQDYITRRVVDTKRQWLVFCYDEIENKNDDFIKIWTDFFILPYSENHN